MLKAVELRDQTAEELVALERDLRRKLFEMKNKREKDKSVEKPHESRIIRKEIARVLTVLKQKKLAQ